MPSYRTQKMDYNNNNPFPMNEYGYGGPSNGYGGNGNLTNPNMSEDEYGSKGMMNSGMIILILSFLIFLFLVTTLYQNYKIFNFIAERDDCENFRPDQAYSQGRKNWWLLVIELLPAILAFVFFLFVIFSKMGKSKMY